MKWDCGFIKLEKIEARGQWHHRFAWYPVKVGSHDCRWLEVVERKGTYYAWPGDCYWAWEYRSNNDDE